MGQPTRDRVSGGATLPPAHERSVGAPELDEALVRLPLRLSP
jgi:hypothetical protein